ncbi:LLM class flavin-dependent oxidoreductase [Rhodococcus sp. NPDC003322]
MGVGVGWQEAEYDAAGMPFDKRFGRLEETVAACRALWGAQPASFSGNTIEFADFHSLPRPIQDRIPMVFGVAPSKRNFERIARVGDGWAAAPADVNQLEEGLTLLHRCFEEQGRDPRVAEVQMIIPPVRDNAGAVDYGAMTTAAEKAVDAGVSTVLVQGSMLVKTSDDIDPVLTWLTGLKG